MLQYVGTVPSHTYIVLELCSMDSYTVQLVAFNWTPLLDSTKSFTLETGEISKSHIKPYNIYQYSFQMECLPASTRMENKDLESWPRTGLVPNRAGDPPSGKGAMPFVEIIEECQRWGKGGLEESVEPEQRHTKCPEMNWKDQEMQKLLGQSKDMFPPGSLHVRPRLTGGEEICGTSVH